MFRPATHYADFALGLFAARRYPAHHHPEAVLSDQLHNREARFLDVLQRVVFARPSHPLHQMLLEARCNHGDVANLIAQRGLESALELLRTAGVFLSHAEFKGREPIVRGGQHIPATTSDFVNPLVASAWRKQTSGSTGAPTLVPTSLSQSAHRQCYYDLALRQLGVRGRRWLSMSPILPSTYGITRNIWNRKSGFGIHRWYAAPGNRSESRYHRAVTRILLGELRLLGVPVPRLTFLPQNDFLPVARELAFARRNGIAGFVSGSASSCVRVAAAALENGFDISGTRFWTGGEDLSTAKASAIHRAGAESYATYLSTELGSIGFSCPHYEGQNTVHHFQDGTAIISASPMSSADGRGLFFSTLLRSAPLFLLNFELGDQGVVAPARCGCRFSKLGFDKVITGIRSYTRLTGHGITQTSADVIRVIEEILPARFGGSPSDYQLTEQEVNARTVMVLRVNPRIGVSSAADVEHFFLDEIRKLFGGSLTVRTWTHAGAFSVLAEAPLVGDTGKILPLRLLESIQSSVEPEIVRAS